MNDKDLPPLPEAPYEHIDRELYTAEQMHAYARAAMAPQASETPPIDMVLHCPACGLQHIDAVEPPVAPDGMFEGDEGWDNPPHRSHLCHGCGHIWRPADVPTNGVAAVKTVGKADSPMAAPQASEPTDAELISAAVAATDGMYFVDDEPVALIAARARKPGA